MPSRKIEDLHPALQPLCLQFLERCKAAGHSVFITQTYRSTAEQHDLYAQGRTQAHLNAMGLTGVKAKPEMPRVTNVVGGKSEHNFTLNGRPAARAFDIAFMVNGKASWDEKLPWKAVGAIGQSIGLDWGGAWLTFKDKPHFQLKR